MLGKEVVFTENDLRDKLSYWQKVLRLQDWVINTRIRRQREMSQPDRLGEISFNVHNKVAFISILDPVDYDDWVKQDMEQTLVHELLHLHLAAISLHFGKDDSLYEMLEEQAIECISHGLIARERRGPDGEQT